MTTDHVAQVIVGNIVSLGAAVAATVTAPATWVEMGPWALLVVAQLYANIHLWRALQDERHKAEEIAEKTIERLEDRDRKFIEELRSAAHSAHNPIRRDDEAP
jgi:ABC-type nickel/cobalt efflux system permease component RcnA